MLSEISSLLISFKKLLFEFNYSSFSLSFNFFFMITSILFKNFNFLSFSYGQTAFFEQLNLYTLFYYLFSMIYSFNIVFLDVQNKIKKNIVKIEDFRKIFNPFVKSLIIRQGFNLKFDFRIILRI